MHALFYCKLIQIKTMASEAAPSHPPWQVRWKRPQWEHVQEGITDPEHDSFDGDDSHNDIRYATHENYYTQNKDDDLDPSWVPISSSSITLTRKEAHAAILELRRRDKLLIRRKKTTKQKQVEPTPTDTDDDHVNVTPLVDNAKTIQPHHDTPINDTVDKPSEVAAADPTVPLSAKSLTAPSTWFSPKSGNSSTPNRPPRGGSSKTSPSRFNKFRNYLSPPRKAAPEEGGMSEIDNILDIDDDDLVSPPPHNTATDASTASSLLWEDRTLTSVSEEDAAAFRRHGTKGKGSKRNEYLAIDASSPADRKETLVKINHEEIDWEEEGFENVVILVTIFASNLNATGQNPSTGDVVLMELLSAQDPPVPLRTDNDPNNESGEVTTSSRSKQQPLRRKSSHLKVTTSSSSSLTTPSPSSLSHRSTRGGGGSIPTADSHDSSSLSKSAETLQQKQHYLPIHGEEVETPSNYSRLLARRVLRWPTSVVSKLSSSSDKSDGCPSFVALGRTTVREEEQKSSREEVDLNSRRGSSLKDSNHNKATKFDQDARIADAMDAIHSLSFLFGGEKNHAASNNESKGTLKAQGDPKSKSDDKEEAGDVVSKKKQPLSLCFVTNDGDAHFFHAMRLFLSRNTDDNGPESDLSNSFASFVMGTELFTKLRQDVAPLSRPDATVKLSQVAGVDRRGDNSLIWKDMSSETENREDEGTDQIEKDKDVTRSNWANLTNFDASIDPATVSLRTLRRTNVITASCFTSDKRNSHLVVCGKGLRRNLVNSKAVYKLGGFVTFVSLLHHTESKTMYLPFAPQNIHPVYWEEKHFVVVSGEGGGYGEDKANSSRHPCAVMIRVDSSQVGFQASQSLDITRFHTVPIKLPSISESLGLFSVALSQEQGCIYSEIIGVSSIPSSPPGIIISFQNLPVQETQTTSTVVVNLTFDLSKSRAVNGVFAFGTSVRRGHRVLIDNDFESDTSFDDITAINEKQQRASMWCVGGQGWSLIGHPNTNSYFVCWDGSTEADGPFVLQFERIKSKACLVSGVMPLIGRSTQTQSYERATTFLTNLPSPPSLFRLEERDDFLPRLSCSLSIKESIKLTAASEGGIDDIIVRALDSISNETERRSTRSKKLTLSHKEKSSRLLRHCNSWTQLQNRGTAYGQVLFAFTRFGTQLQSLSLRTNSLYSPLSTPFNQVLAWLCQRRDYFTAASVALSLLDDADAVYDLRGISRTGDIGDVSIHKGLIDGITPLCVGEGSRDTMTSLADMAVGCLIKGGSEMSVALTGFLLRNELYDASATCLMLVGAATAAISHDTSSDPKLTEGQNIMTLISNVESPRSESIWPVKCLLQMAVVRKCLRSTLLVLNTAIPNELRWRVPLRLGAVSTKRPSLGLFISLMSIILESCPEATRILLDLLDEESGMPFWFSIDEDTRLALSLVSVHGKYVMLQEPEVRAWALERLKNEVEFPTKHKYHHIHSHLSDEWLREIVSGAFCNAETDIAMGSDLSNVASSESDTPCYRESMRSIKHVLIPKSRCGLDFDLLIAALLILAHRRSEWREGSTTIPTQILLNALCEMAGKRVESKFIFDSATVLRQCALAENVQAAALLAGGKNGLILECVDLITSEMNMKIQDAETALFAATVNEFKTMIGVVHKKLKKHDKESQFTPSNGQLHLLWLLEEHVLSVVKYGEFESSKDSAKLEPIFVGRLCFRAWYSLTRPYQLNESTKWMEAWLRTKLELSNGASPKRLACAALVRVLLWVDEAGQIDLGDNDQESILATLLQFDGRFIAELSQACCGLIQSIPPHLADEVNFGMNHFSFEGSGPLLNAT